MFRISGIQCINITHKFIMLIKSGALDQGINFRAFKLIDDKSLKRSNEQTTLSTGIGDIRIKNHCIINHSYKIPTLLTKNTNVLLFITYTCAHMQRDEGSFITQEFVAYDRAEYKRII